MNKKELRKSLELELLKTIETVLNKQNSESAKKIRKTTSEVSRTIAKKFYKSQKTKSKAVAKPKPKPKTITKAKPKAKPGASFKKIKSKK